MRRLFKLFAIAFLFVGMMIAAQPVVAANIHYEINVYKDTGFSTASGGYTAITSGITYQVLTAGSVTESTIYSDSAGTAMTNPVTTTIFDADDQISFYIDSASTTVDIIIVNTAGGYTTFLDGATTSTRTAIIDQRPNMMHHGVIWFKATTSSTEVDTGIDLQIGSVIHNVILEVVTAVTSNGTIDIGPGVAGTAEDTDGFIDGMSVATAGWYNLKECNDAVMGLTSASSNYIYADSPLGALLGTQVAGTLDIGGVRIMWDAYITSSDFDDLAYVFPLLGGSTGDGYIHYFFTPLRTK